MNDEHDPLPSEKFRRPRLSPNGSRTMPHVEYFPSSVS